MVIQRGERIAIATEFHRGDRPHNALPVGATTIRIDKQGKPRAWRKIQAPNVWIPRAQAIWQAVHGPIPHGYILHHCNERTLDDWIENLELVSRAEHIALHRTEIRLRMPPQTHLKKKTCPDCGVTWQGRGRSTARCPACRITAERTSQ